MTKHNFSRLCNRLRLWLVMLLGALIKRLGGDTPKPPEALVPWDLVPFSFRVDWYQEITLTTADSPQPFYEDSQSSSKWVTKE